MLATCFSTVPRVRTKAAATPALDRPSAISASTSRSRGVSGSRSPACRLAARSWLTTSRSSAVPPAAPLGFLVLNPAAMPMPIIPASVNSRVQRTERKVRSLIHSIWATFRNE
jgi:hypothetical protein